MQNFDPSSNNPFNKASFQEYRTPGSDSEEEITTRQEPSFIEEPAMEQGQQGQPRRAPTMEEQMMLLMTGMQQLLQQQQSNQRTNNFTRPKLPEPDTYQGDRSPGAVESWIRTMERYLELSTLEEHEWVPFAIMKLRDEAEEWWEQRSFHGSAVTEWADFRKHIIVEFRPLNATQQARGKLAVLHQTGTVTDYVAQFRGVRIQIPSMTDEEALDRFTRGLQDDIRAHVVTRFPSTSEEAQRMALAYESARNIRHELASGTQARQERNTPEYLRSDGVAPMDLDVIRHRPTQPGWRNYGGQSRFRSNRPPPSSWQNKQCYNCGGMGHVARMCPSQPSSSSRASPRGRQETLHVVQPIPSQQQVPEANLIELEPTENVAQQDPQQESSTSDIKQHDSISQDQTYIDTLCSIKENELPLYSIVCNGVIVSALIDSGATASYVSPHIVMDQVARKVPGRAVETAGGHTLSIDKQVTLALDAAGYKHSVDAFVLDTKFDVILGRDWLKAVNPIPAWHMDTWQINKDGHQYLLRPKHERSIPDLAYLLSDRQLQRHDRRKLISDLYLCFVRSPDDVDNNESVQALLNEFKDVFQDKLPGLPRERDVAHIIDTGDAAPINRPPFKMSPLELDELRKQLKELLDLRLIRPSTSPWGAPVLFVRKKSGELRMCIDYRAINQITRRHGHPLPRIDECLERLSGAQFFTSLDLKSGYHQLRIRDQDVPKTAFNTRYGSYEWLVVPFGLRNSPALFQSTMNRILNDFLDDFVMVYLDDILIYSKNKADHEMHVRKVLQRLREEGLIANLRKCEFFKTELEFLGFQVSGAGTLPSTSKVKAIQEWPVPTNVQEVRQFVGLGSHYRRFIRDFAAVASPLTDLTKGAGEKKRAIVWTEECQRAFEEIKSRISQAPILAPPDPYKPYIIETDACDYGVGAVLLQEGPDGVQHPVAFESKKLSNEERSYPAQEREMLAILHALRAWRCFIEGRQYTVFSDHNPLKYFRTQAKPTPRLTRWVAEIELYDPIIQYKPGKENCVPDLLSRRDGPNCISQEASMEPQYLYAVKSIQESDWPKFYASPEDNWPAIYKDLLLKHKDKFVTRDQQVFRLVRIGDKLEERRYVQFARRADLVRDFHHSLGHAGKTTVVDHMVKRWWWPNMRTDIQEWLASCAECQLAANANRKTHHAPMVPLEVPPPFSRWHLDFIGELPTTKNGNRWLLVAVDYATNWCCARAVPNATGESINDFIYEELMLPFGCMNEILTDRGTNFSSKVLTNYLGRLKVKHKFTSAFHPRTNAKAERTNGILKQMIRKYVNGQIHRWDEFIHLAVFACRVRKHRTTGFSPYFLVYGQEPKLPGDHLQPFVLSPLDDSDSTMEQAAQGRVPMVRELRKARATAEQRLKNNAASDKARWDALMKPQVFAVGDHVLMRHENKFSLEYNWKGPYRVLARNLDTHIYQIQDMNGNTYASWVHTDRLRPIHINSTISNTPWYDPTASRAQARQQLAADA